jgi:hypothetical protein
MSRTLYGIYDQQSGFGWVFGSQPNNPANWSRYMTMPRRVSLKRDFRWREVQELQNVLRKSDIWSDFPARGYTLVNAEFKGGDEDQRIDLLYLRNDGALLPCELKIGGDAKDSHGQLMRYIADLFYQGLDVAWVRGAHDRFLESIHDDVARDLHRRKFDEFLSTNNIEDRFVRLLPRSGLLIDEGFPPQLVKAVRYLNGYCGFAIRMLQIDAAVENDWTAESQNFLYKLDFVDVQ